MVIPCINPWLIWGKEGGRRWRAEGGENLSLGSTCPHQRGNRVKPLDREGWLLSCGRE